MDKIELPPGWKVVKLGEISKDIQSGGTPSRKKPEFYGGSIPWIKTLDLNENIVTKTEEKITQAGFESIRGKIRPINTVMVAMYGGKGTVGKSGILGIPATTNQAVCCIEPNPNKFDSFYLLYYLIYFRPIWMRYAIGTRKDPNISKGIVERTEIPLPPLPEQKSIAHTLRTIQKAKETRQRELELERERKAALMEYLFTHGTRNEARKQTEIGEIPESWNFLKLEEVADIVYGVQAAVAHLTDNSIGIPILTNINITNRGIIDLTTLRYYELPEYKKDKLILKTGDILFNWRSGSQDHVGKTALFDLKEEYTFSSFILRFRANNKINNIYLFYYLQYLKSQGFFARKSSQSSINSVFNASVAATIPVMLPFDLSEQLDIISILKSCDRKIQALEKEISLTDELFHATLEELMTGKLSTKNLIAQ